MNRPVVEIAGEHQEPREHEHDDLGGVQGNQKECDEDEYRDENESRARGFSHGGLGIDREFSATIFRENLPCLGKQEDGKKKTCVQRDDYQDRVRLKQAERAEELLEH
jgi:hypothetical protein